MSFDPQDAARRYHAANAETLRWMLDRAPLGPGFLDTKVHSLTLRDYTDADGLRGPGFTYGWIQGRGLEALATHASETDDPARAARLDAAARRLYGVLTDLLDRDGHGYFCYDADLRPVVAAEPVTVQERPADIWTYTDAFWAKGLVAAAARHAPEDLPRHVAYLARVVDAIRRGRFQMDERVPLSDDALCAQPADFGPRMILLGACPLLRRIGRPEAAAFGAEFLAHVLDRHLDPRTGLLANVPGGRECNPGHAIELVGFAFEDGTLARPHADRLLRLLAASFRAGFGGTGIALSVDAATGETLNPLRPWWSLPETIRAAALAHAATRDPEALRIWEEADAAFFAHYWRPGTGLAIQTRGPDGPVDHVPATPDLDPGYHTGLSLLAAARAAQHMTKEHT